MSDSPLDPLPPSIVALLEREKMAYPDDTAMKRAVLSRIETVIGLGSPGGGGDGGATGDGGGGAGLSAAAGTASAIGARALAGVALASFIAGGVVGGAVVNSALTPSAPSATTAAASAPPSAALLASSVPTLELPAPAPSASLQLAASSQVAPPPPAATASAFRNLHGDLTRERELLDVARASLGRGNAAEAIAAAERHASKWPRGQLAEEREVIWIQALVAAGQRDEADRRAARFRSGFPSSVLTPAVDAALRTPGGKTSPP